MAGENFSLRESQLFPIALISDPNGLLGGGGGGVRTDQVSSTYFRALFSGVGYSLGDILQKFVQFDAVTLTPTGNEQWFNVNRNAFIAAPADANISSVDNFRLLLSSEVVTISTVASGLTTIPATCNYAEIQVHDASIVFTYDGVTVPTASPDIGVTQHLGDFIVLQSRDEVLNFNAIRQASTDVRLYVQYLKVFHMNNRVSG